VTDGEWVETAYKDSCSCHSIEPVVIFSGQRYDKTREIQKENLFFFLFPSASIFGKLKVTTKY
jgi:hypothetical protein